MTLQSALLIIKHYYYDNLEWFVAGYRRRSDSPRGR